MLVECIPNISEGRDKSKVQRILSTIKGVPGTQLLHTDSSYAANRTVITFVSELDAVVEAGYSFINSVYNEIDMSQHQGIHPRLGACDVFPVVPLDGKSFEACKSIVAELSDLVSSKLDLPVYNYEKSAKRKNRISFSNIRKGEYENLEQKLTDPNWSPDYGPSSFNKKFGALTIGVRDFLIAYNVTLNTKDLMKAKLIASLIREASNSKHSLSGLKAIGWLNHDIGLAQVSCNITKFREVGLWEVFSRIKELAAEKYGDTVFGSELIGLVPKAAIGESVKNIDKYSKLDFASQITALEDELGLKMLPEFELKDRIIENLLN